jgi:hypothetical protein
VLRFVPLKDPEVVKAGDRGDGMVELVAASSMVTKNPPVFHACNRVFDACSTTAVLAPPLIAHDAATAKSGCPKLRNASISAVRENAPMALAERFNCGASVVDRVVAISWATGSYSNDAKVATTHEHLRVARPAVVLGFRSACMVPRWNERAVDDPRPSEI